MRLASVSCGIPVISATVIFLASAPFAFAGGCADYPYTAGEISYEETPAGTKILATGAAAVDFDDADDILDATTEARMEAKAAISHFLTETIKSDTNIESASTKISKKTKNNEGQTKSISKEKIKKTLKTLSTSSRAMLRGVVQLATCYTKGRIVMVSVGLKPETIKAAEGTAGQIGDSIKRQPTGAPKASNDNTQGSNSAKGENSKGSSSYIKGMDKLKKF